jgi:hypothetical protein
MGTEEPPPRIAILRFAQQPTRISYDNLNINSFI